MEWLSNILERFVKPIIKDVDINTPPSFEREPQRSPDNDDDDDDDEDGAAPGTGDDKKGKAKQGAEGTASAKLKAVSAFEAAGKVRVVS